MLKFALSFLLLTGLFLSLIGCVVTKKEAKQWYKGNLHAHSYWSDGDEFPEMIMDWYKVNDYNFTVLSDHNTLNEGDKWITVSEKEYLQKGFQDYLEKFGASWVNHEMDSLNRIRVKLKTYEEYQPLFEENGKFLMIPSEELTTYFDKKPIHINATNIQEKIDPKKGDDVASIIQNNIDAILDQRKDLGIAIMPHLNHPNFGYGVSVEDLKKVSNLKFFEVYNGHPLVNNYGDESHLSVEAMWDTVNINYLKNNKPLLFGIAADDSHHYHQLDKNYSNAGRGWVMVLADSLNAESIISAMENGDFYASTGVVLKKAEVKNQKLHIEIAAEPNVAYEIQFIGVKKNSNKAEIISTAKALNAELDITDDYLFVRTKIISNKTNQNFFDESEYEKAWTQPIKLD
ncbi:MAG: histidinol-phosphatase [Cellulophaga sp.]|nr:histidinol-phosphatase [Cellulophaga sp.]